MHGEQLKQGPLAKKKRRTEVSCDEERGTFVTAQVVRIAAENGGRVQVRSAGASIQRQAEGQSEGSLRM